MNTFLCSSCINNHECRETIQAKVRIKGFCGLYSDTDPDTIIPLSKEEKLKELLKQSFFVTVISD